MSGLRGEGRAGPTKENANETGEISGGPAAAAAPSLSPHTARAERAQGGSARNPVATPHTIPSHHTPALSLTRKVSYELL